LWIRIVTNITGRPVRVCADREVSAAGAAALARQFLDRQVHASSQVAALGMPLGREVLPDPSTAAGHDAPFGVYRRMYPALRELFSDLAAASGTISDT